MNVLLAIFFSLTSISAVVILVATAALISTIAFDAVRTVYDKWRGPTK